MGFNGPDEAAELPQLSEANRKFAERLYVALDYDSINDPEPSELLHHLQGTGAGAKVGLQISAAKGWINPIETVQDHGMNVFADAKLKDIGATVSKASRVILKTMPNFINVHADSSASALRMLVEERNSLRQEGDSEFTKILGVTVLTDKENDEAVEDYRRGRKKQVLHYADKSLDCGLDGIVCSPDELKILAKYARFDKLVKMVPAIRPKWSVPNDQKNYTTPTEAIERGATHIVVGRPITEQYTKVGTTPFDAFEAVVQEVAEAA